MNPDLSTLAWNERVMELQVAWMQVKGKLPTMEEKRQTGLSPNLFLELDLGYGAGLLRPMSLFFHDQWEFPAPLQGQHAYAYCRPLLFVTICFSLADETPK